MPQKILIRRGLKKNVPVLSYGELGYSEDSNELFIGNSEGKNQLLDNKIYLTDFGAIGDGVVDDTQALKDAVLACSVGGTFEGRTLIIPVPSNYYLIKEEIVIDSPISIKGEGFSTRWGKDKAPSFYFDNSPGFYFKDGSSYSDIEGISIYGTKKGGVNISSDVYKNYGIRNEFGSNGIFDSIRIEGFDVGILTVKQIGETWSGAYRYFNYVKVRNCNYSVVQKDSTQQTFNQCDFRSNNMTGYIWVGGESSYQTTDFISCMFEALGKTGVSTKLIEKNENGFQFYNSSYVKIIGGYVELSRFFVGKMSQLVCSAYLHLATVGFNAEGYVDLNGVSGYGGPLNLPFLDDSSFWDVNHNLNLSIGVSPDGKLAYKFDITGNNGTIISNKYTLMDKHSFGRIPVYSRTLHIWASIEYICPSNVFPEIGVDGVVQETYCNNNMFKGDGNWKHMYYTAPLNVTNTYVVRGTVRPKIIFVGSKDGDVCYVRKLEYGILGR